MATLATDPDTREVYSVQELAAWCWSLCGRHSLPLNVALTTGWPLDDYDRPVAVTGDVVLELPLALAKEAIADGVRPVDILRSFADALDPVSS
jgi:hypothetical protein